MAKKPAAEALTVQQVPISSIQPADYNPRNIASEAMKGLVASMKRFGMPQPLVINKRTGVLVSGHQRLKAAQELDWKTVPVIYVDVSEPEERALNVTLNSGKVSGFFTEDLQAMLDELRLDLPDDFFDLRLEELVIPDSWGSGTEGVDKTEENLDGIKHTIKVKCPEAIKDEVLIILKRAFLETSLEGVEVV